MSDTEKRNAVLAEFKRPYFGLPDTYALIDEILRLRDEIAALRGAVERVRALHAPVHSVFTGHMVCDVCRQLLQPCPTLRALEVGRE